ncbi:MAG: hypothetical protein ACYCSW_07390 [bacterium]
MTLRGFIVSPVGCHSRAGGKVPQETSIGYKPRAKRSSSIEYY